MSKKRTAQIERKVEREYKGKSSARKKYIVGAVMGKIKKARRRKKY